MHQDQGFRGTQWDYRRHVESNLPFIAAEGRPLDDIKRRALTVLRSLAYGEDATLGLGDVEGPLWALVDVSFGSEKVKAACVWFRLAASSDDETIRQSCCIEAYERIERVLRCFL